MKCENIACEFEQLAALAISWSEQGLPCEIERDIVLSKLAAIYEQIKFADAAPELKCDPEQQQSLCYNEVTATPHSQPQLQEPQPQEPQNSIPDDIFIIEPLGFTAVSEPELTIESAQSSAEYVAEDFAETAHPQNLFDDDFMSTKRTVDRSVILSLYGDDSSPRIEVVADTVPPQAPEPTYQQVVEQVITHSETSVLGESFTPTQSVADVISSSVNMKDVASSISNRETKQLRGAIGLNDKFLMIRDVFANDAPEYEVAIETLERFDNLDDALLYLYENHNQNPNSDGAKLLVELLTRKLS